MTFTADQIAALAAPLTTDKVKKNPRGFDYVEGWHAIAEANRIFGFGQWDRTVCELRQLGEPREVDGKQRVGYMARVRITVRAGDETVVRDGCGYGSGIDRDLGQAHESALKEAETDAMKRALMTFGNPFGLALYDKARENVAPPPPDEPRTPLWMVAARTGIDLCNTVAECKAWNDKNQAMLADQDPDQADEIIRYLNARAKAVRPIRREAPAQEADAERFRNGGRGGVARNGNAVETPFDDEIPY